jgi:Histidine kinase
MNVLNSASLINLLGFTIGGALYALLLAMVVVYRRAKGSPDYLLLATSLLGLVWNVGELASLGWRDFEHADISPVVTALAYSALGFLPSVVVHAALKNSEKGRGRWLIVSAYCLSVAAALLHFQSIAATGAAPSSAALEMLSGGSLALLVGLLILNYRSHLEKKAVWISALLVFAVSALHLSEQAENRSWIIELVHQSSLPLALAILLQDYRFAFADLFLKRALSLILLALVAFGLYVYVAAPLLLFHESHERNDVQAISIVLTLWIATALVYPGLYRFAAWLVDKMILRRADYDLLRSEVLNEIEGLESAEKVLTEVCATLAPALTAKTATWKEEPETGAGPLPSVNFTPDRADVFVPTAEPPFFQISLNNFAGGRHLLSDEIEMLEAIALIAARRIDTLRVTNERYEQQTREREFSKLAAEAQLSALRAQINPHFLFNALTTIGYLIQTTPDKAFSTLMRLTQLLRGVLKSADEFSTLDEELMLIESYLEIEKARFEERLVVKFEVPRELRKLRVPSLILQPLVENAVKHGVAKQKAGGEISVSASIESVKGESYLLLTVTNTGGGFSGTQSQFGVGLTNISERLRSYYGKTGTLEISGRTITKAVIKFPASQKFELAKFAESSAA